MIIKTQQINLLYFSSIPKSKADSFTPRKRDPITPMSTMISTIITTGLKELPIICSSKWNDLLKHDFVQIHHVLDLGAVAFPNGVLVLQEGQRFNSQVVPLFVKILASNFLTMDRGKRGRPHWMHLEMYSSKMTWVSFPVSSFSNSLSMNWRQCSGQDFSQRPQALQASCRKRS
jgi:hypothetical protein